MSKNVRCTDQKRKQNPEQYTDKIEKAHSVDPDEMAHMNHLISFYYVCKTFSLVSKVERVNYFGD